MKKYLLSKISFTIILFLLSFLAGRILSAYAHSSLINNKLPAHDDNKSTQPVVIAIDAGHGGADPGKVSSSNICEKDINLSIALKLAKLFEQKGYKVVLTRRTDKSLSSKESTHPKNSDLLNRTQLIDNSNAVLFISIHQNSFKEETSCGPQVFFYSNSDSSKKLAHFVQDQLNNVSSSDNTRSTKPNSDYFLLKNSSIPGIIAECGFLSNPNEALLLTNEDYQLRICRLIYIGVIKYLKSELLN